MEGIYYDVLGQVEETKHKDTSYLHALTYCQYNAHILAETSYTNSNPHFVWFDLKVSRPHIPLTKKTKCIFTKFLV